MPESEGGSQDLVDRLQRRDPQAFTELVQLYRGRVLGLAYRILGSTEDAEDVSQEVFVRAYQGLARFRRQSELGTWLYRITVNTALNQRRRERPTEPLPAIDPIDPQPGPEAALRGCEVRERLAAAYRAIPPKQRAVLALRLGHGLGFAEIARIVGSRLGTAKANYFHAVRKLRTAMEGLL